MSQQDTFDDTPLLMDIPVGNSSIKIMDSAKLHSPYDVMRYLMQALNIVPHQDMEGLSMIHLLDDPPDYLSGKQAASYYHPEDGRGAIIAIYLNDTLGFMPSVAQRVRMGNLSNRIFLATFGKPFLAAVLYHEIGHHRQYIAAPARFDERQDKEVDAENYSNAMLKKMFPFMQSLYGLFNGLYKIIFARRIRISESIRKERRGASL